MKELKIKVGHDEVTVAVESSGHVRWVEPLSTGSGTHSRAISVEDAMLLVQHLVGAIPTFGDPAFYAVEEDVSRYLGRLIHNKRVEALMKSLSSGYFEKDLSKLSGNEFELIRRTAEAEVAVAEAVAKAEM